MSRALPAGVLALATANPLRFVVLVRLEFDGGTIAFHSGHEEVAFEGETYVPSSNLGEVGTVLESAGTTATTIEVTLSGVSSSLRSLLQSETYMRRPAYIHLALTDESFTVDPAAVFLLFSGSIDDIAYQDNGAPTWALTLKSRLADWERNVALRYTDADQQYLYPGDKGLEFVGEIAQKKLVWPIASYLPDPRD